MKLYWHAKRKPTRVELAAIRRAVACGQLRSGAHIAPAAPTRSNPDAAKAAYKRFHWGREPRRVTRAVLPDLREGVYELGELVAVEYRAKKGRNAKRADVWRHQFESPRPTLTATPSGRLGPIVGGGAHVTERGIEQ